MANKKIGPPAGRFAEQTAGRAESTGLVKLLLLAIVLTASVMMVSQLALAQNGESPSEDIVGEANDGGVDEGVEEDSDANEPEAEGAEGDGDDSDESESNSIPAGGTQLISRSAVLVGSLTVFMLAVFVGFEVITKVPPTLHTPLMSGSNAISGITIVGAMLTAGSAQFGFGSFLGMAAVVLAAINVVGGFLVTHRMLMVFKKK